ncbi:MAG: HDOD domain-containing protein [Pseudomonadota bacterium]
MSKSNILPDKNELKKAFEVIKGAQIPSVPDIVVNLHAEFEKEEPDIERISDLVAKDQAITGQVIKTVNSPLFGLQQPVESIPQAVVLLGLNKVKNLVTAAAFQSKIQAKSPIAVQIWHDSLSVAQVAMKIAQHIHDISQDEAYLAALLHNCGAMLLAEKFPGYEDLLRIENEFPAALIDRENRRLGSNHVVIGYMFAKHWKLPERVCQAIYHHHDLRCEKIKECKLRALIAILKLAHQLVMEKYTINDTESLERIQFLSYPKQELMLDEEFLDGLRTDAFLGQD